MYAGFVDEYPPDVDNPTVLRRLLAAATDLQLATLMDGLVDAAVAKAADQDTAVPWVIDAIRLAASLAHADRGVTPAEVPIAGFDELDEEKGRAKYISPDVLFS